ncbi:hypothetical protein QTP88_024267 [Uroleucon formosanum]
MTFVQIKITLILVLVVCHLVGCHKVYFPIIKIVVIQAGFQMFSNMNSINAIYKLLCQSDRA